MLDYYTPKLLSIFQAKKGAIGERHRAQMSVLLQVLNISSTYSVNNLTKRLENLGRCLGCVVPLPWCNSKCGWEIKSDNSKYAPHWQLTSIVQGSLSKSANKSLQTRLILTRSWHLYLEKNGIGLIYIVRISLVCVLRSRREPSVNMEHILNDRFLINGEIFISQPPFGVTLWQGNTTRYTTQTSIKCSSPLIIIPPVPFTLCKVKE